MINLILMNTLYLLALINPVSKISILSTFASDEERKKIIPISMQSTVVAFLILLLSMIAGEFILRKIFHVDFYSLKIGGGIVLFWAGFGALSKGIFFRHTLHKKFSDISIAPLACPMIAGPATITIMITLSINHGILVTTISTILALSINMILMFLSFSISNIFLKFNILGGLIRLTGLIVLSMGVQMILEGMRLWLRIL